MKTRVYYDIVETESKSYILPIPVCLIHNFVHKGVFEMNLIDKSNPWNRENDESILEIYDVEKGTREAIYEFDYLIEAPNWSKDGKYLTYNSNGKIYKFDLAAKEIIEIFSDFVTNCNNDHVLSPDGYGIAVSHGTKEDGKSRIYTLPLTGGVPRLITPLAPSYLHGWSPDGKMLSYCAERNG